MINYVIVSVGSVSCGNAGYLILNYLKVIVVGGGDNWGPCGAGIFQDGSCDGFVGVNDCFFIFPP